MTTLALAHPSQPSLPPPPPQPSSPPTRESTSPHPRHPPCRPQLFPPSFPRRRESTFPAPSPSALPSATLSAVIPAQAGIHVPVPAPSALPSAALSAVIPAQAGIHVPRIRAIRPAARSSLRRHSRAGGNPRSPHPRHPPCRPQLSPPSFPRRRESTSPTPAPSAPPPASLSAVIPAQAGIHVPHARAIRPAARGDNHKGCPYPSSATPAATPQPSFPRRRESTSPAPAPSVPPPAGTTTRVAATPPWQHPSPLPNRHSRAGGIHVPRALTIRPAARKGNHKGCPYPSLATPAATPQPSFPRRRESTSPAPSPSIPPPAGTTTRVAATPPWQHPSPLPNRHSRVGGNPRSPRPRHPPRRP